MLISVPSGVAHDAWAGGNNSARIGHLIPDEDLFVEFKVDSQVTQQYQSQGFFVEFDQTNFLRFDFYSDGAVTNIHSGAIINNSASSEILTVINQAVPTYMRIRRTGDLWEQSYSYNGANWTVAGSFVQPLAVVSAGLFAGNVGSQPTPAHTASFDYYRLELESDEIAVPITGVVSNVGVGSIAFPGPGGGGITWLDGVITLDPLQDGSVSIDPVQSGNITIN